MARVHPNIGSDVRRPAIGREAGEGRPAEVLTVWRKSLLLNCNGFTVFDAKGNLVFRVDNYAASNRVEVVLMDASGKPLLTLRRKVIIPTMFPFQLIRAQFAEVNIKWYTVVIFRANTKL